MAVPARLYLDSARLGRMRKGAQLAVRDFVRLAGEDPFTLYSQRFFKEGFALLSTSQRRSSPGLSSWQGVAELKATLCHFLGADDQAICLFANRSLLLARLAARAAAIHCRKVLVTDLGWPPYVHQFKRALWAAGKRSVTCPIRDVVFQSGASARDLHDLICSKFAWHECDGIFLPAISHDGVRLPVDAICRTVRSVRPSSFIVVDAAQALAHVPNGFGTDEADIVLTGAHKWLGAGMPLGIAIIAPTAEWKFQRLRRADPLLEFVASLSEPQIRSQGETVNVWPLVACRGALAEFSSSAHVAASLERRLQNGDELRRRLTGSSWRVMSEPSNTRSAIVLLAPTASTETNAMNWRRRLEVRGISATVYPGPVLRLSMPDTPLSDPDWMHLLAALHDGTQEVKSFEVYG